MKKLTLKQLYGFSIMNWEQFQKELEQTIEKRECSFCRDSNWRCDYCRINKGICDDKQPSIYNKISSIEYDLRVKIINIIKALREEYYKVR